MTPTLSFALAFRPRRPLLSALFFLVGLLASNGPAWTSDAAILYVVRSPHAPVSVWRLHASGAAERLQFDFGTSYAAQLGMGTTGPVASPDQRWVAFTRDNDLWLLQVPSLRETRLTDVGQPYDEQFASVFVYVTAWSADSQHLLYSVTHGMTDCIDCSRPDYEVRPVEYGFRIYNLDSKSHRPIALPGEFRAWLPDGDFLLATKEVKPIDQLLLRYTPGKRAPVPVGVPRGWAGQVDVGPQGRFALAHLKRRTGTRIVRIDLLTGDTRPVTPAAPAVAYQWPRFSPSGTRIAYEHRESVSDAGIPQETLEINGRSLHVCRGRLDYRWITDSVVALICQGELLILDTETGIVAGRHLVD